MTVVAAIARDNVIVMGADWQTNYGPQLVYGARKIRSLRLAPVVGDATALLACSGNGGILATLERNLTVAAPAPGTPLNELQGWADAVAAAATEVLAAAQPPLLEAAPDGSQRVGGAMLLGYQGHLFYLFTHQAVHVPDGVASLGSGSEVALGAMHTAMAAGHEPDRAVSDAVRLACRFCDGCGLGDHPHPDVLTLQ